MNVILLLIIELEEVPENFLKVSKNAENFSTKALAINVVLFAL